ncbi:hypothetical protein Ancab_007429 [Ancistrocladus abbreviatus]
MAASSRTAAVAAVLVASVICLVNVESTTAHMVVPAAAHGQHKGEGGVYAPGPGPNMEGGGVDSPPPGPDCSDILLNAADCLPFFSPGSNETVPDSPCCPELKALVGDGGDGATCLCHLLSNPSGVGFNIDVKKALKLPSLCGLKGNPVALCNVLGIPIPTSSEGPAPAMSPGPASAPGTSSTGSAPAPPSTGGTTANPSPSPPLPSPSPPPSGATSISISHHVLAFSVGLALAFLLSSHP